MADPVDTLREQLATVVALGRRMPAGIAGIAQAEDTDLVALLPAVQALVRTGQGVLALAAGEVQARDGGAKDPSLARRLGQRTAASLVADRARTSFGEARRLVAVGQAIRPRREPEGGPERPHVAEAVLAGELSLHLAALIDETLDALAGRLDPAGQDALEATLVEQATGGEVSVAVFVRDCARLVATTDPDGTGDRDEALRAKASWRERRLSNGLWEIVARLDPERAAYYRAAMTAKTNPHRDHPRDADGAAEDDGGGVTAPRPGGVQPDPMVTRLDAFVSICRNSLQTDGGAQAGVDTTVLVRIDAKDLESGTGSATIDGIDTPISAATARRMAVHADLIPQVFGGRSQLLDQGESRRLFSKAQRYATYAHYDGCAFPGCDLPLAMTQIHHIGRWATRSQHRKGTDHANGIPLCGFHNRLMETGWDIRTDPDRTPWFTPPPHLDPQQTPLRGTHHHAA